jgi:hypothetical protein
MAALLNAPARRDDSSMRRPQDGATFSYPATRPSPLGAGAPFRAARVEGLGDPRIERDAGLQALGQVGVGDEQLAEGHRVGLARLRRSVKRAGSITIDHKDYSIALKEVDFKDAERPPSADPSTAG